MRITPLLVLATLAAAGSAQGQTSTNSPKVEKSCTGLNAQATKECLKVAKQMDHDATSPHQPATKPDSVNPPAPETVQHSSSVMRTPDEVKEDKKADAKARKEEAHSAAKAKADSDTKPAAKPDPQ